MMKNTSVVGSVTIVESKSNYYGSQSKAPRSFCFLGPLKSIVAEKVGGWSRTIAMSKSVRIVSTSVMEAGVIVFHKLLGKINEISVENGLKVKKEV